MGHFKFAAFAFILTAVFVFGSVSISRGQSACNGRDLFTAAACSGDTVSVAEAELLKLINGYRKANNRPELRSSKPLSMLANRRTLDLRLNVGTLTHSWSNCTYNIADQKTWPCLVEAPQRFPTGYPGQGYETLYRTTTGVVSARNALESWKKSNFHNSIILNLGQFKDLLWEEMGVAIDGSYASLWFGFGGPKSLPEGRLDLGGTYDEAVGTLTRLLAIDKGASVNKIDRWIGSTPDKQLKAELIGSRQNLDLARVEITVTSGLDGKLSPQKLNVLTALLKNLFPEWPDADRWLNASLAAIAENRAASRTKVVRKVLTELRANGRDSILMTIKPQPKGGAYEVF